MFIVFTVPSPLLAVVILVFNHIPARVRRIQYHGNDYYATGFRAYIQWKLAKCISLREIVLYATIEVVQVSIEAVYWVAGDLKCAFFCLMHTSLLLHSQLGLKVMKTSPNHKSLALGDQTAKWQLRGPSTLCWIVTSHVLYLFLFRLLVRIIDPWNVTSLIFHMRLLGHIIFCFRL